MTPRRKRLLLVLAVLGGVSASVALAIVASRDNLSYYYPPSEVAAVKPPAPPALIAQARYLQARTYQDEEEWSKAATHYRVQNFSAKPAINLRPTGGGVEVHVRYITRAQERQATRARLYEAIVELLHGREAGIAARA